MDDETPRTRTSSHAGARTGPLRHAAPVLVLIVDDEKPIASIVALAVEELGYPVHVAAHGREALDLIQATWPALVITDLMMPMVNGADLIAALRAEEARHGHPRVPVILMTAAGLTAAHQAGADAVLAKPFDLAELEQLIQQVVREPSGGTPHLDARRQSVE
jgi:CheY-like chemotaxis protein